VWLDQLDIRPGDRWDRTLEDALTNCPRMVVIFSPASVNSTSVMDEVSFALEEKKTVIPVIYRECAVPFRLRRVQHVDFRQDYARGLQELLKILAPEQTAGQSSSAISDIGSLRQSPVPGADERQRAAEKAPLEEERRKAAERTRLEEEREQAAEQARVEQERRRAAEQARLEEQRRKAAEQTRLEEERKQAAEQARMEQERRRAADEARLEEERRKSAAQAERVKRERELAEHTTQKKLLNTGWIGALSASKFNLLRIASPTIRRSIGAGAMILIVAIGSWLAIHYRSLTSQTSDTGAAGEPLKPANGRTNADTGTVPAERPNANTGGTPNPNAESAGSEYKILREPSNPNSVPWITATEHWEALNSAPSDPHSLLSWTRFDILNSIFGTSDGKRLWAVDEKGTILASGDGGEHWNRRDSGTQKHLRSIIGSMDGLALLRRPACKSFLAFLLARGRIFGQ
jgi:hypothetical protein